MKVVKLGADDERVTLHLLAYGHGVTIPASAMEDWESVVAWARNSIAARAAYDALREQYPQNRYSLRQRSHEMADSAEEK